jgi:hypothetical protein
VRRTRRLRSRLGCAYFLAGRALADIRVDDEGRRRSCLRGFRAVGRRRGDRSSRCVGWTTDLGGGPDRRGAALGRRGAALCRPRRRRGSAGKAAKAGGNGRGARRRAGLSHCEVDRCCGARCEQADSPCQGDLRRDERRGRGEPPPSGRRLTLTVPPGWRGLDRREDDRDGLRVRRTRHRRSPSSAVDRVERLIVRWHENLEPAVVQASADGALRHVPLRIAGDEDGGHTPMRTLRSFSRRDAATSC